MEYNMPYQHSIIIGNYNDFNFFPSILLDFKENKYFEMYFQSFIIDGYDETMKAINTKNYLMFKIYDNSKEIAYAYNLDIYNFQFIFFIIFISFLFLIIKILFFI